MKSLAILGGNSFALVSTTHEFTFIPGTKTWNIGCPDNLVSVAMQCPDSSYIKKYPKHAKQKILDPLEPAYHAANFRTTQYPFNAMGHTRSFYVIN